MDVAAIVVGGLWVVIVSAGLYWAGIRLLCRVSPKFAAKCRLHKDTKLDRRVAKWRKRQEDRENRLIEWAGKNPDDPTARALLARRAPSPSPISVPSVEKESDSDLQAVLRQRQREMDDLQAYMEARELAEALLSEQLLEWALTHPKTPEGCRYLEEKMIEASEQIESADRDIRIVRFVDSREDSPEAIAIASFISEAEGRKEAADRMIRRIQAVVTSLHSDPQ